MCFHYSLTQELSKVGERLKVSSEEIKWQPAYHANGFSFLKMPVITSEDPTTIQLFNWGLVPSWIKTKSDADKIKAQTLNARSETVFEKPSFRSGIIHQRCLIPADGFFDWMEFNKKKYPHYIFIKNKEFFCFAGIYSNWVDKETGEIAQTFSILTTEANSMMERIHNIKKRMPVIIDSTQYEEWLQSKLPPSNIKAFFTPYPADKMESYTIGKLLNSKNFDSNIPPVIEPVAYPELD